MKLSVSVLVGVLVVLATDAFATMAPLTDVPGSNSAKACRQWAKEQNRGALEMWGIQTSGISSKAVAINRLARYCVDGSMPEIIGFGASVGFNDRYCKRHPRFKICRDRI